MKAEPSGTTIMFQKFVLHNEDWLECLDCGRLVFKRYTKVHTGLCPKSLVGEVATLASAKRSSVGSNPTQES